MSAGLAICLVCGEPLDYLEEAREGACHICGKKEILHIAIICDIDNMLPLCVCRKTFLNNAV